ncbi:Ldh family oxidoreductase (plasmid) [Cereibacter azotoformans]|uniref:Ldh family oxidoreductase n=2 Tax=Cereibacter azotoformans TaxID=43057 RepID=UPI003B21A046
MTALVALDRLEAFCQGALAAAGADEPTATAASRAMLHGSRLGVDSHGVRLLDHYVRVIEGGRVNGRPTLRFREGFGALAVLEADHAHGALAAYRAMDHATDLASRHGIGAVAIRDSSHFGPAGAYALAAAHRGQIGLAVCNSDAFVRLHDGASRFHGTNPIAAAAPSGGEDPWLFDMATSAVPYNRVQLNRSLGRPMPEGVASDAAGIDTTEAAAVEMLAPLGHAFAFKGAGLAGLVEILSAVLTGMRASFDILPMAGPDLSTPRRMGAFVLAIRPDAVIPRDEFEAGMRHYLAALRASPAREGARVLAPGDREWAEARRRAAEGVPLDPATEAAFAALARRFGLATPF